MEPRNGHRENEQTPFSLPYYISTLISTASQNGKRRAEQPCVREALNPPLPEVFCPFNVIHLLPNYRNSSAQNEKAVWACICIILVYGQNRKICDGILSRSSDQTIENFMKYNFISKIVLSAVLLAGGYSVALF